MKKRTVKTISREERYVDQAVPDPEQELEQAAALYGPRLVSSHDIIISIIAKNKDLTSLYKHIVNLLLLRCFLQLHR